MIPNVLLIETDTEILTFYSTEPGTVIEIDRKPRPLGAGSPSKAPMVISGRTIYRMEFFTIPAVTEEMARKQSKKARKLIAEFRCKTGTRTKRPAMAQIEIDRETMTRFHEVTEKNEDGLWETVHRHRDKIKKRERRSD